MTVESVHTRVFRKGSRTYFTSSMFFPAPIKRDIFALYAFVRIADDMVDACPQDKEGFSDFRERYTAALRGGTSDDPIIGPFVELSRRRAFPSDWTEAFLNAMESDLGRVDYDNLEALLPYIYGSAEVIGLFMSRIMGLPEEAMATARLLGRSMQYINFIRDVGEDLEMGRHYLPPDPGGFRPQDAGHAAACPTETGRFLSHHLKIYRDWKAEAEKGFAFIPKRYLVPIKTASDMYGWTGARISRDPGIVFREKVKPGRPRILLAALANAFSLS